MRIFNTSECFAIGSALRIAAERYKQDAAMVKAEAGMHAQTRAELERSFKDQEAKAIAWAEEFEGSDEATVR